MDRGWYTDFKTINVPIVYMARGVMLLMRAISITRAIGIGRNRDFLGPEMARSEASVIWVKKVFILNN
jgi:hypothetical protein